MIARTRYVGASTSCQRSGTHIRVLIAVPADAVGTLDVHRIADNLQLAIGRLIVLIAPTIADLDTHNNRLRDAARQQGWELVPANGMHHRIIDTLATTNHRHQVSR